MRAVCAVVDADVVSCLLSRCLSQSFSLSLSLSLSVSLALSLCVCGVVLWCCGAAAADPVRLLLWSAQRSTVPVMTTCAPAGAATGLWVWRPPAELVRLVPALVDWMHAWLEWSVVREQFEQLRESRELGRIPVDLSSFNPVLRETQELFANLPKSEQPPRIEPQLAQLLVSSMTDTHSIV